MRPLGSENRAVKDSNPYSILALRIIEQAVDDLDTRWLRGKTYDLAYWLHVTGLDMEEFHKRILLRFPRKPRMLKPKLARDYHKRSMRMKVRKMVDNNIERSLQ